MSFIHTLFAQCSRGCTKQVHGQKYLPEKEKFSEEEINEFKALLKSAGWTLKDENGWVWYCEEEECKPPFDIDPSQFSIRPGLLKKYGKKLINPDYFGEVTIANLE